MPKPLHDSDQSSAIPAAADASLNSVAPDRARWRWALTIEQLLLVLAVYWLVAFNAPFLQAALQGRTLNDPSAWGFGLALAVMVVALHVLLMGLVVNRWTGKALVALLIIATALAGYYMSSFGVYLDPSMLRNVMRSDVAEARELLSPALLLYLLLYAALPLLLLWRVRLVHRSLGRAALVRLGALIAAAIVAGGAVLAVFQPFASLMRNQKDIRYLITPANYLWSAGSVAASLAQGAAKPRQAIGLDAKAGPSWNSQSPADAKPRLLVIVVGETARAANWGLTGYARQTTPELAALPVINFRDVSSCGTNTEVSVPCLFAPVGRRDYKESRIRGEESLLHVLARAGVAVQWRDNQSGCKGVCEGLPNETIQPQDAPGLCDKGRCFDEALLLGLDQRLLQGKGTQVLVLHMLGNHGPSYFRRYPAAYAKFAPACEFDDLQKCTRDEIVNAYDNALLYTDHVLAALIKQLQASAETVDSAMIYVSDHGESLGENNLFLHGLPYAVAPFVQTKVPMVLWFSDGMQRRNTLDKACLQRRSNEPTAHDHLFHTTLGLLDVQTSLYDAAFDLTNGCRGDKAAAPAATTATAASAPR